MCFSAETSFGSAATLIAAGAWCVRTANRRAPWFRPLAVVPCLFGAQQVAEGLVWVGLHRRAPGLVQVSAGVYLFFALAFWPTWFSVAALLIEPEPGRRRFLAVWAALSTAWFVVVFLPLLGDFGPPGAREVNHSIRYDYADAGGRWQEPLGRWAQRLLYCLTSAVPLLATSARRLLLVPVGSSVLSAAVAACLFDYAFTSVWCLWSAVASLALMHAVSIAPPRPLDRTQPRQQGGGYPGLPPETAPGPQ
jgi:hypothetical protein